MLGIMMVYIKDLERAITPGLGVGHSKGKGEQGRDCQ